jgi:probable HAF family extracellular repeat protein
MVDLGTLGGGSSQTLGGHLDAFEFDQVFFTFSVNDNGQVVGESGTGPVAAVHAFVWTAIDGMVDLGTLAGSFSGAHAINGKGQVVGQAQIADAGPSGPTLHAFSWTATAGIVDLGTLGGTLSVAYAVNERGRVVGESYPAGSVQSHATMWMTLSSPPKTTATLTSTSGINTAGWSREAVTVALAATSELGPADVASITYRIGQGPDIVVDADTVSFVVTDEGQTAVSYYAEDRDGNIESPNALAVAIDRTSPSIHIATPSVGLSLLQGESVPVTYECVDALSGLASCMGPVSSGSPYPTTTLGHFDFVVYARDGAGNEANVGQTYLVITPVAALENLLVIVQQFHLKRDIARSLTAQLHGALAALTSHYSRGHRATIDQLTATLQWVNRQRGRGLTDDQAAILTSAIERIIAAL